MIATLAANVGRARAMLARLPGRLGAASPCPAGCDTALENAIITPPEARDPEAVARLTFVAGRVLGSRNDA